jgi:hypothetical protein
MSKTWNMPYISETALRSVKFNRKILPPQHIVVNPFSAYPVSEKEYVHKSSIVFDPKYTDFQADANIKIETCSMKEYIFQP